jgi:hypothetical protein
MRTCGVACHSHPQPKVEESKYPNDSFYSTYLKRSMTGVCSFVFVASTDSMRLYSLDLVLKGDRSPIKKVKFSDGQKATFCCSFHSVSGSGALLVSENCIQCFSLPRLEAMDKASDLPLIPGADGHQWSASLDGQLILTSQTNELVRYSSLVRAPLPIGAKQFITVSSDTGQHATGNQDKRDKDRQEPGGRNASARQGITNIIGTVKGAATAASELVITSMQDLEKIGDESSKYVQTIFSPQGGPRDLPSVADVFQKEVTHLDEEVVCDVTDTPILISDGKSPSNARTSKKTPISSVKMRSELLGPRTMSSSKYSSTRTARRTASSVKRHYGAASRSDNVRTAVENTRNALAERGKKLENLQEKGDELNAEAEDFSSMARDLEKAFAERKWYQM